MVESTPAILSMAAEASHTAGQTTLVSELRDRDRCLIVVPLSGR